jgi:Domain of unknown function (DUF4258)
MNFKKALPLLLLIVLALLVFTVKYCKQPAKPQPKQTVTEQTTTTNKEEPNSRGLNRHPQSMHYSKHAKCRMECRHIDESEIKDILEQGTINYRKSELQGDPCRKKYAVEGLSKDGQKLRVIFAPCGNEITVVTCIDLGVEWACDCK